MAEDVSPDPYEPFEVDELQQPPQPPAFLLPFVPIDAEERIRLSQKMAQQGVLDPEHLSCAEPVDILAHNPSPTELAPLDIPLTAYEVSGGFSGGQQDFGISHPVQDFNASLPQVYYRTYEQWPAQQPDAFAIPQSAGGLSHGPAGFAGQQHFGFQTQPGSGQYWR